MASKKNDHSGDKNYQKFQEDDYSLIKAKNLDNKTEIGSQTLEVSKGNDGENGFLNFGFNQSIINSLKNKGYKNPTPIQKAAIPELMLGRDLLGQAQTGTGKTAAFALPLIEKLSDNKELNAKVLVMTPTRELATQVAESFKSSLPYMIHYSTRGSNYYVNFSFQCRNLISIVGTSIYCYSLKITRFRTITFKRFCHLSC